MVTLSLQPTFQGAEVDAVAGQVASLTVRFNSPRVMLKLSSYWTEAELRIEMTLARADAVELKTAVYVQSVATPTSATFRVEGQPAVDPILVVKLTPAEFPPVCPSIWRPKIFRVDMDPQ